MRFCCAHGLWQSGRKLQCANTRSVRAPDSTPDTTPRHAGKDTHTNSVDTAGVALLRWAQGAAKRPTPAPRGQADAQWAVDTARVRRVISERGISVSQAGREVGIGGWQARCWLGGKNLQQGSVASARVAFLRWCDNRGAGNPMASISAGGGST